VKRPASYPRRSVTRGYPRDTAQSRSRLSGSASSPSGFGPPAAGRRDRHGWEAGWQLARHGPTESQGEKPEVRHAVRHVAFRSSGRTSRPLLYLTAISQALAALTKISFLPSPMKARALRKAEDHPGSTTRRCGVEQRFHRSNSGRGASKSGPITTLPASIPGMRCAGFAQQATAQPPACRLRDNDLFTIHHAFQELRQMRLCFVT